MTVSSKTINRFGCDGIRQALETGAALLGIRTQMDQSLTATPNEMNIPVNRIVATSVE